MPLSHLQFNFRLCGADLGRAKVKRSRSLSVTIEKEFFREEGYVVREN